MPGSLTHSFAHCVTENLTLFHLEGAEGKATRFASCSNRKEQRIPRHILSSGSDDWEVLVELHSVFVRRLCIIGLTYWSRMIF